MNNPSRSGELCETGQVLKYQGRLFSSKNSHAKIEKYIFYTSTKTSSESVSSLFFLLIKGRCSLEFFVAIGLFDFDSGSESSSVASRTVVNDNPLSISI